MRIFLAILMCVGISFAGKADPGDHWPWGAEMPFPWKGIQGTWAVYLNHQLVYFSFRTIQSKNGTNQLEIVQYDGRSCQVLASGGGFEEERVVRGMVLMAGHEAKNITIHVFSEAAMNAAATDYGRGERDERDDAISTSRRDKTYTVMSMGGLNDANSQSFQLQKVNVSPTGICSQKKR
jgi:hypothetical protein